MQHSPAPTDTPAPTGGPVTDPPTEPPVDPTTEPTLEPTIEPTAEPTVAPTAEPVVDPTAEPTPIPIQTSRPPVETAAPPADRDIYELRYIIPFAKDSDAVDGPQLTEQLKEMLTTSADTFSPPGLEAHYLAIRGCVAEGEDEGLALKRARFVRTVLKEIGFPDNRLLDYAAEDGGAIAGVQLSFMAITGPTGDK